MNRAFKTPNYRRIDAVIRELEFEISSWQISNIVWNYKNILQKVLENNGISQQDFWMYYRERQKIEYNNTFRKIEPKNISWEGVKIIETRRRTRKHPLEWIQLGRVTITKK